MPIVFAAVVPHSPLLVSSIAKDHHRLSLQTREAMASLMAELYARQVETLLVLTPHGAVMSGRVTLAVADTLTGKLSDFGDPRILVQASGAVAFAHQAKEVFEDAEVPVQLQTFDQLDYGTTVPLSFVSPPLPRILPIHVGNQSRALLLRFGRALYQACHVRTERFGLLASADLVRRDQPDASARPLPLERTISHVISAIDLSDLSAVPEDPAVCGLNPIVALIAALAPLRAHGTIRSFEVVTRVGLLTASFDVGT